MSILKFLKSKYFFIQIAVAIAGLLIFIFALKFWLKTSTNHDQKIQVPNLHKMSIENVNRTLEELNLGYIVIDSASFNPEYPKKSVIEQSPEAGDFVKEKRKIYLTLNPSKYRDISIPDLNGSTKRHAISQLRSKGLNVDTSYTYVKDIGKDVVRGLLYKKKVLNPGDQLPLNSIVELVLGDGEGN
ncbi:PASTA domain-containing protein [Polaribacter sargassicola]|uniref:PASTA domain-containing protein n=1 Tax=Polaribacter sargassicola TaxID=2836891 RepID=UPI001F3FD0C0|nr:PASTA domain-containing protein [Polaribacter sp. DS7-9]MCG1035617.1 PASTA domain-containing protein [Polaribacter sp. DS7-9]